MSLKIFLKMAAWQAGGFRLAHRMRNRERLTVLMFHRVLPPQDILRLQADPVYTMALPMFAEIVAFAARHYTVVGLSDVLAARAHEKRLPPFPVLITFDDGWRDNADHVFPLLKRARLPWSLFAARDALSDPACWWQETLLWARRTGRVSDSELLRNAGAAHVPENEREWIAWCGALAPERRWELLAPFTAALTQTYRAPQMLDEAGLRRLDAEGVAIGVHGSSHLALDAIEDPAADLAAAAGWLQGVLGRRAAPALSFPHGRYDARSVRAAREAGFRLLFTSEGIVNPCPGGWLETDLVGRISMAAHDIGGDAGHISNHRLAPWLFLRQSRRLDA